MSSSVTNIGVYAFNKTGGTFCCEAESQPKGWDGSWNYNNPAYTIVFSCQAGGVTEDGVLWYQTNDEVHLYGYMGTGTQLILPSSIGGASVKYIEANAFKGATSLTKVVISICT
jgi:hypothetical protein